MMKLCRLVLPGMLLAIGIVGVGTRAQNAPPPGPVRNDISGDWTVVTHEDMPNYGPGPELGDYAGLPINAAARQGAEAWDAGVESQPERQAHAHPIQYISNNRGPARILKVLDPVTQVQVAYTLAGSYGRADRVVWMDGRPHPSDYSEHTTDGFSTGVWDGGAFVITTTHLRQGYIRRNGVIMGPYEKMVEHFVRHGSVMSVFMSIDDPTLLEEPEVRSYTEVWNPGGNMAAGQPFEAVDELGSKPLGWVPFYPMGTKHREYAESLGLPFEVTQGGMEGLYPEYQLKVQQMLKDEAAKQALVVKKAPAIAGVGTDPFFGAWKMDKFRSTFVGSTPIDQRTLTLEAASGGGIRHSTRTVSAAVNDNLGFDVIYNAKLDGKEYPAGTGAALDTVAFRRIDPRTLERTGRIKGQVVEVSTWVISPDGKTLTFTTKGTELLAPGAPPYSSVQVFDRQ